jgi:hypothetical protein
MYNPFKGIVLSNMRVNRLWKAALTAIALMVIGLLTWLPSPSRAQSTARDTKRAASTPPFTGADIQKNCAGCHSSSAAPDDSASPNSATIRANRIVFPNIGVGNPITSPKRNSNQLLTGGFGFMNVNNIAAGTARNMLVVARIAF